MLRDEDNKYCCDCDSKGACALILELLFANQTCLHRQDLAGPRGISGFFYVSDVRESIGILVSNALVVC